MCADIDEALCKHQQIHSEPWAYACMSGGQEMTKCVALFFSTFFNLSRPRACETHEAPRPAYSNHVRKGSGKFEVLWQMKGRADEMRRF